MKEKIKPMPTDLLDFWVNSIEQMEFWTDVFVNSKCLSEADEIILEAREFISDSISNSLVY